MRTQILLTGLAVLMINGTGNAAGVPIQPGMWEMTSTMTMTMMNQPQTNTVKQCIESEEISPESFNMKQDSPCKASDINVDGNKASWSINCTTGGGMDMVGQWEFTSYGDSISGSGTMSTESSGQTFGFDMKWSGKRIGDCN